MFNRNRLNDLSKVYKILKAAYSIENLVLEGGSVRGLAHIGVIHTLETAGFLSTLKRVAGSSIGGLVALAVAIGYKPKELDQVALNLNLSHFFDFTSIHPEEYFTIHYKHDTHYDMIFKSLYNASKYLYLFSKSVLDIYRLKGIFNGHYIESFVRSLIQAKFPDKLSLTFAELHQLVLKNPAVYKDLYLTGVNVLNHKFCVFSHETTPNMPIEVAVHISMAFPGLFKMVKYEDKYYLDGGLYNNLALELFDAAHMNSRTLGVALSTSDRTHKIRGTTPGIQPKLNWLHFLTFLLMSPLDAQDALRKKSMHNRTIYINLEDVFLFNIFISEKKMQNMIERGKTSSQAYLKEHIQKIKVVLLFYLLYSSSFKNYLAYHTVHSCKPSPSTAPKEAKKFQNHGFFMRPLKQPFGLNLLGSPLAFNTPYQTTAPGRTTDRSHLGASKKIGKI